MKRIILQPVYAQILHVVGLVVESWLVINLVKRLVDQGERVGAQLYVQHILMNSIYGSVSAGREKWPFNVLFFLKKSRASV